MKNYYKIQKQSARDQAINWQLDFNNHNYSIADIIYFANYFSWLGKKYGLIKEFRENGII